MFAKTRERLRATPWRKMFKVWAWFVIGFTLLVSVPSAGLSYSTFGKFAGDVAMGAFLAAFLGLYGFAIFTYIWATSDVPGGWANFKQFWRDFPENWRRFWRGAGAVLLFLWRLPGVLLRGLIAGCRWLGSLPSRWRALDARDKKATAFTAVFLTIFGGIAWALWPVASWLAAHMPTWLLDRDTLFYKLFIDLFMSAFALILASSLLAFVLDVAVHLFRRRDR